MSDNIIELVDITVVGFADKLIFENLNFQLPAGKTAVISGPTGSGKTLLIQLIIGELKPSAGSIFLFGDYINPNQLWKMAKIRRKIGGVGGVYNLVADLSIKENLLHPLILNKKVTAFQKSKINQTMNRFELVSKMHEKAGFLSQGEKNEVMLARAIIADQPLLLIDEPLAGVDPAKAEDIKKLLIRLSTAGHSLLILTADPDRLGIPDAKNYRIEKGQLV